MGIRWVVLGSAPVVIRLQYGPASLAKKGSAENLAVFALTGVAYLPKHYIKKCAGV